MRGVYMEIFLSLLYSVVFLPVLDLTFFFYYYYFQLHCSSQPQIHSSPFLFKFYFKHLTEKVLIIFYFKVYSSVRNKGEISTGSAAADANLFLQIWFSVSIFSFQGIETPMPHKSILLAPRFSYQGNVAEYINKISEENMWSTMFEVVWSQVLITKTWFKEFKTNKGD